MKKLSLVLAVLAVLLMGTLAKPALSLAQGDPNCQIGNISGCSQKTIIPSGTDICNTATGCIIWFVNIIFLVAVLLSFVYLIWGGIDYIMAGGDTAAAGNARTKLTNAVIGLVVVILAWAISNFVLKFFGLKVEPIPTSNIERLV